jgi:hypothetical protein
MSKKAAASSVVDSADSVGSGAGVAPSAVGVGLVIVSSEVQPGRALVVGSSRP